MRPWQHTIYIFAECPGCGIGQTANAFNCTYHCGLLASPMYPYPYPSGVQVTWTIRVEAGSYISLSFSEVDVQSEIPACSEDYVLVHDVNQWGDKKLLARLCNVKLPQTSLESHWNIMSVTLVSDAEYAGKGFMAEYYSKTFTLPESLQNQISFDGKFIGSWY